MVVGATPPTETASEMLDRNEHLIGQQDRQRKITVEEADPAYGMWTHHYLFHSASVNRASAAEFFAAPALLQLYHADLG